MATVIKNFKIKSDDSPYIVIETRNSGITSFLLNLIGLEDSYKMICDNDSVDFELSSLKGRTRQSIPLSAITEVITSIEKPIGYLMLAGVFFVGFLVALVGAMSDDSIPAAVSILPLAISIILLIMYILKKNILFAIKNGGDKYPGAIHAVPAIVAGERIDETKFREAAILLRDKINQANKKA